MIKYLIVEALPLNTITCECHEISTIVLVVDDSTEVKQACKYPIKIENASIEFDLLGYQGYTESEIGDNPMYSYQAASDIIKTLDLYVNKDAPWDKFILTTWHDDFTSKCLGTLLSDNGCKRINDYFIPGVLNVQSLFMNQEVIDLTNYKDLELSTISREVLGEACKKDSLSRAIATLNLLLKYK